MIFCWSAQRHRADGRGPPDSAPAYRGYAVEICSGLKAGCSLFRMARLTAKLCASYPVPGGLGGGLTMSLDGRLDELARVFFGAPASAWINCSFLALNLGRRAPVGRCATFNCAFSASSCRQRFFQPKSIRIEVGRARGENPDARHIGQSVLMGKGLLMQTIIATPPALSPCKSSWRRRSSCLEALLFNLKGSPPRPSPHG